MIPAILFFLVLLMPPFFLSVRRGKRFEETIALSSGSMILFMFVCGMAGLLKISVYMILGITVILAGASVWMMIRKKQFRAAAVTFFTPAFFAFFRLRTPFFPASRRVIGPPVTFRRGPAGNGAEKRRRDGHPHCVFDAGRRGDCQQLVNNLSRVLVCR